MGNCSGHGQGPAAGVGCTFQPGHGGGMANPCETHAPMIRPNIGHVPVISNELVAKWIRTPQLPKGATVTNVVINGKIPIINGDELTPHPTETMFITQSVGDKCFKTLSTPAWYCTTGGASAMADGCEGKLGHDRKLFATTKTVFVNGQPLGRFGDPFGTMTGSGPYPCLSTVAGSSPNVFVGV